MKMAGLLLLLGVVGTSAVEMSSVTRFNTEPIEGQYIVVLKKNATSAQFSSMVASAGAGVRHVSVTSEFRAMMGKFDAAELQSLSLDTGLVDFIEQDHLVQVAAACPNTQRSQVSWGLSRVATGRSGSRYPHDSSWGRDVDAYIIDSGVNCQHSEFSRCSWGANYADNSNRDGHGHGSHVAGTVGGRTYGVAKSVNIIAVKVLKTDGTGPWSGIIDGINYAVEQRKAKGKASCANMSIGGGRSQSLDSAVNAAVRGGLAVAVAAGNEHMDACNSSPAASNAVTVASSDKYDARSSFSNYGSCTDIFAPGSDILSVDKNGGSRLMSGTSMATPHVVGAMAVYLGQNPRASHNDVWSWLKQNAESNAISDARGTPNKFLRIPCSGSPAPPTSPPTRPPTTPPSSCNPQGCYSKGCDYYLENGYSCEELKDLKCNCSGCKCERGATLPPKAPSGSCKPEACFTHGCEFYTKRGYTCTELETVHKCDCSGCKC